MAAQRAKRHHHLLQVEVETPLTASRRGNRAHRTTAPPAVMEARRGVLCLREGSISVRSVLENIGMATGLLPSEQHTSVPEDVPRPSSALHKRLVLRCGSGSGSGSGSD